MRSSANCGGHPFEILYSPSGHGIHLLPPTPDNRCFALKLTDYVLAKPFVEMVKSLIVSGTPLKALNLENILDYMCGDSFLQ